MTEGVGGSENFLICVRFLGKRGLTIHYAKSKSKGIKALQREKGVRKSPKLICVINEQPRKGLTTYVQNNIFRCT